MSLADIHPALFYLVIVPLVFTGIAAVGTWLIDFIYEVSDQ